MTFDELTQQCERAVAGFSALEGVSEDLANQLVAEGYLSYDDLSVIEPDDLMEMGGLTEEQVDKIVEEADRLAEELEQLKEQQKAAGKSADNRPPKPPEAPVANETANSESQDDSSTINEETSKVDSTE